MTVPLVITKLDLNVLNVLTPVKSVTLPLCVQFVIQMPIEPAQLLTAYVPLVTMIMTLVVPPVMLDVELVRILPTTV